MSLRSELRDLIRDETKQLINLGRLAYAESLDRLAQGRQLVA